MHHPPIGPDAVQHARALAQRAVADWRILTIETSSARGGVRVCRGRHVLAQRDFVDDNTHARDLVSYMAELMVEAGITARDLDLAFVNAGPGSHTGVRIGLVAARMVAWQTGALAFGVNALDALARGCDEQPGILTVLIPCRRGESYRRDYRHDASAGQWSGVANAHTSLHTELNVELGDNEPRTLAGPTIAQTAQSIGLPDANAIDTGWPTVAATHEHALALACAELNVLTDDGQAQALVERWQATLRPLYLRRPLARTLAERQNS